MQDTENWIAVDRFISDASELERRLDSVSTHDSRAMISAVVRSGREDRLWLLARRPELSLSARDEVLVEAMLDKIRARIRFLERLAE